MMQPEEDFIQLTDVRLHIRLWKAVPSVNDLVFVLLHGLSSNARTWDLVASQLAAAGYSSVAVDQRGHGLSTKAPSGYGFDTVTADLAELVETIGLDRIILVGQSWGGNVVLEAGVHYPYLAKGLVFVDGGFIQIRQRGSWEEVCLQLRPPDLLGTSRDELADRIGQMHPSWVPEGVEITLGNFELLPDGTIRPWLSLENHLSILRAFYHQDVPSLFPRVPVPVLICPADDGSESIQMKRTWVETARQQIPDARVCWFDHAAHDIHVDRPVDLAAELISFAVSIS